MQAADLNNLSVTTVTTSGAMTCGGNLTVTGTITVGGTTGAITVCNGRLTLTSGVPVTTADVTGAGTLYWALYGGNQIGLYTGSGWTSATVGELSIAVPAVANQVYDVFIDYNSGSPALVLTAWTNDTTRATALTKQDGIYVQTGALTRRYVGTVRTVTASQLNDSMALRHVWNYYNRVERPCRVKEATDSWNYTTAVFRQANNSTANQLDIVVGVAEDAFSAYVAAIATNTNGGVLFNVSISEDSATVPSSNVLATQISDTGVSQFTAVRAELVTIPAAGRRYFAWLEYSAATGTTSWYGDNGSPTLFQAGIAGRWRA